MSSILLAGLTDHEAAAIEIMVGMNWSDRHVLTIARGVGLGVPEQTPAARACTHCVLDLFGCGLRRYSAENEVKLRAFLGNRSAVLLIWGNGSGWLEQHLRWAHGQAVTWVSMPYTSAEMLAAIKQIHDVGPPVRLRHDAFSDFADTAPDEAGAQSAATRGRSRLLAAQAEDRSPLESGTEADAAEPPVPAWRRAMALADQLKASRASAAASVGAAMRSATDEVALAPGAASATPTAVSLKVAALRESAKALASKTAAGVGAAISTGATAAGAGASHTAMVLLTPEARAGAAPRAPAKGVTQGALADMQRIFPALAGVSLLRVCERALAGQGAQLLRVAGKSVFVVDASQGWIASGRPVSALVKMLHTPDLVEHMEVQPLPASDVDATLQRLFGARFRGAKTALDAVMWELLSDALKDLPLAPQGELSFRLHRFPNFTHLQSVGALDVQLASICSRVEQSASDLVRAFPRSEADVHRFVVLCVLSGVAGSTRTSCIHRREPPAAGAGSAAAAAKPTAQTAARRGFFKSLLDKLF